LALVQTQHQTCHVSFQDPLATFQKSSLQVAGLHDLHDGRFQAGYFESVANAADQADRIDLRANVFQERPDEI
jgi:hypothetical protein